jgi:prephenate dehydrogenase
MTSARFSRVTVLGLGLIGGSLLQAIRQLGIDVVGYDVDSSAAAAASSAGHPVAPTAAAAVHGADLVVLASRSPRTCCRRPSSPTSAR